MLQVRNFCIYKGTPKKLSSEGFDVAIRRIAIQPETVWAKSVALWEQVRGRTGPEVKMPEYIERLKSRKASVGETMDKQKAAKKFDAAPGAKSSDVPTIASSAPTEKPKPPPKEKPKKQEDAEDFATRLMRAKKKAMEERDKDKPK